MPLTRYFAFVGIILLALLFIADACMPILPILERADSNRIAIRIHSELKLPERVVYDTSLPTILPSQTANAASSTQNSAIAREAIPVRTREALAQLQPSDTARPRASETKTRGTRPPHQRKAARRRAPPYEFMMARQAHFGWFGIW
ncbi:hypothetical protein [Bradyrhizobium sp. UFLA05-112]